MSETPKIVSIGEAETLVRHCQSSGQDVVLCHGCFDLVHPGHIRHLKEARRHGARLIVTVTGDEHVAKGAGRPLIPETLRAESLAALDCVDWVVISPLPTAVGLLRRLRPDVYVKGREYEFNEDPRFQAEREVVESAGGRVVFSSGDIVFSSTSLIGQLGDVSATDRKFRELMQRVGTVDPGIDDMLKRFRGKRVLVIGETVLDTYVSCDCSGTATEAPMMSLRPLDERSFDGGSAIIARHIARLGATSHLLTTLPGDTRSEQLQTRLAAEGVTMHSVHAEHSLAEKKRFLVGTSKMFRLDCETPFSLDGAQQKQLEALAEEIAQECDAVIVNDLGLGMLASALLGRLCTRLRPHVDIMTGDVSGQRSNLLAMREMDLVCPTEIELRHALHDYNSGMTAAVWNMLEATGARSAIVTLGAEGLTAFDRNLDSGSDTTEWISRLDALHVPAVSRIPVDQLGCGDSLLAVVTLALAAGASLNHAALLGTIAASVQTQTLGQIVIDPAALREGWARQMGRGHVEIKFGQATNSEGSHDHVRALHP